MNGRGRHENISGTVRAQSINLPQLTVDTWFVLEIVLTKDRIMEYKWKSSLQLFLILIITVLCQHY